MDSKYLTAVFLVAVALCVSGCDFMRRVAGRPTAAQVASMGDSIRAADMRALAEREAAAIAAAAAAHEADSLRAAEAVRSCGLRVIPFGEVARLFAGAPPSRYALVIGSFGEESNAGGLVDKVRAAGYDAVIMRHRNGHAAVAACPSDDVVKFWNGLQRVRTEPFVPSEAWILIDG